MDFERRQFQTGPTRFRAQRAPDGWIIVAAWWEINRGAEKEQMEEVVAGPMRADAAWFALTEYRTASAAAEDRRRLRCA